MKVKLSTRFLQLMLILFLPGAVLAQLVNTVRYERTEKEAKAILQNILKTSSVIDGHNDLFIKYFDCKSCPRDLDDYRIDSITTGQIDIPRMREGNVGGVLLNVFGREKSLDSYMQGWDLLYRMEERYKKDLTIVGTAAEMRKGMQEGKITILPSLEGAGRLGENKYLLRAYHKLGLRSVTFAYKTNQFADGSEDTAKYNGISAKGKEMVQEMNKLGVIIDMSHVSTNAMNAILDVSTAPVIFSHSNARALCNVNRNVPDDVLKRLKANRGIIMLCPVPYFTSNANDDFQNIKDSFFNNLMERFQKNPEDSIELDKIAVKWEKENPEPIVTVADLANHFDYVKKLIGVDHIGIGGDYDGIISTIQGMEDISSYPKLLTELIQRGWTAAEIKKITSENFLRVFTDVEKQSKVLQTQKIQP